MHGPLFQRSNRAMRKLSSQSLLPKEGPVIAAEVDDKRIPIQQQAKILKKQ